MKRGILIVTVLLLTVLVSCATPKSVKLTGVVNQIEYTSQREFVRYHLEKVVFDEDSLTCGGTTWIDVPTDDVSESVRLNQTVHVQCYCNNWSSIPSNACFLEESK